MEATLDRRQTCDVAVVGGGILGIAIAALVAQRGYHVIVFRLSDHGRPRADTLRNQGWLQSGLIYVGHYGPSHDPDRSNGRALSARMRVAGLDMLRELGLPPLPQDDYGIYRLADEDQARKLEADARALRLSRVARLRDVELIRRRLGAAYDEGGIYYSIPDLPFPEAAVLSRLRDWATSEGASFVQVDAPLHMVATGTSESGVELDWGGSRVGSRVTIAAAGCGNPALLSELGIDTKMSIQQTPLLVVHDTMSIQTPIFADRARGFSFVRHDPEETMLPDGALVIGTKSARVVPYVLPDARGVSSEDVEEFKRHLPPPFVDLVDRGRFTAGFELLPHPDLNRPYVAPWVEWCEGFPALMMAMPGRATMGVSVARQVLGEVEERLGAPQGGRPSDADSRWSDDIFMHFHRQYEFDDSKSPQGRELT